jgi:hypothetical protein
MFEEEFPYFDNENQLHDNNPHATSMPNLSFHNSFSPNNHNNNNNINDPTAFSQSVKFLKKKVFSEDKLLQTVKLPPHHLRKQRSPQARQRAASSNSFNSNNGNNLNSSGFLLGLPSPQQFGHRKTPGEEFQQLNEKR